MTVGVSSSTRFKGNGKRNKDYGDLIVCNIKSCHKPYHRGCMDESLLKGWRCDRHTCTYSLCKGCIQEAEFTQGFCRRCMEKNEHGNKEMDTGEYFNVIHKEEPADRLFEAYADQVSNSRSYSEQHEVISSATKKARRQEGSSIEAIPRTDEGMPVSNGTEWASNELLEFVSHMKHGDTSVLSYFDVQALLVEYIARNNLFVPHQKSRILCDSRLQRLFGKTCMGQFEMFKLLHSHLMKKDNHADHIQGRLFDANRSQIEVSSEPLRKVIPDKLAKIIKTGGHALPETNYDDCAAIVIQLETQCFLDNGDIANGSGERTDGSSWNREIDDPQINNWDKVRNQVPASETVQASLVSTRDRLWCYQDPSGKIQGPFSILQLCKWSTTASFPANLRIWRTMEMQEDSILLIDALNTTFSRAQKVAAAYEDESVNGCKGIDSSLTRTDNQQIDLTWDSDLKGAIGLASCNLEAGKSDGLSSEPSGWTAETVELKVVFSGNSSLDWGLLNGSDTVSACQERISKSTLADASHAVLQDVLDPQTTSETCFPTMSEFDGEKSRDMSTIISVEIQGFAEPPQPALDEALMDVGVNSETLPSELASSSGLIGNSSGNCDNLPKENQGWDFSDKKSEQGPIIKSESLEWSNELPVNQKMRFGSIAAFAAEKPVLPFEKWRNDPCVVNSSAAYVSTHTISEYNLDPDSKPSCGSANPPKLSCGGPAQETVTMDLVTASEGNEATNWGMSQLGNVNNGLGTPAGNTAMRRNYQEIYENRYSRHQNRVTMLVSPYWKPYRNQLCWYHQRGYCKEGGFCRFRHPSL